MYKGISILDETPFKFIAKSDTQKNKWHYWKEHSLTYLYAKILKKKKGPIPKADYKHASEQWIQRLKRCVADQGAYFDKMQAKKYLKWVKGTLHQ